MTRHYIAIGLIVLGGITISRNFGIVPSQIDQPLSMIDVTSYLPSGLLQNSAGVPVALIIGAGLAGFGLFLMAK